MKNFIFILLIFTGCASHFGEGWTVEDSARQARYSSLLLIDWKQTAQLSSYKKRDYYELGIAEQAIGNHPKKESVDKYMASSLLVQTIIAGSISPKYRKLYQEVMTGYQLYNVVNNFNIGLDGDGITFKFTYSIPFN